MDHFKAAFFTALAALVAGEECVNTRNYSGQLNSTSSGHTCQRWDSQEPHSHNRGHDELFPVDGSATNASNFCRDPEETNELWCYTMDPSTRWEHCNLISCEAPDRGERQGTCQLPTGNGTFEACPDETEFYGCRSNLTLFVVSRNHTCEPYMYYCCKFVAVHVTPSQTISPFSQTTSPPSQATPPTPPTIIIEPFPTYTPAFESTGSDADDSSVDNTSNMTERNVTTLRTLTVCNIFSNENIPSGSVPIACPQDCICYPSLCMLFLLVRLF